MLDLRSICLTTRIYVSTDRKALQSQPLTSDPDLAASAFDSARNKAVRRCVDRLRYRQPRAHRLRREFAAAIREARRRAPGHERCVPIARAVLHPAGSQFTIRSSLACFERAPAIASIGVKNDRFQEVRSCAHCVADGLECDVTGHGPKNTEPIRRKPTVRSVSSSGERA